MSVIRGVLDRRTCTDKDDANKIVHVDKAELDKSFNGGYGQFFSTGTDFIGDKRALYGVGLNAGSGKRDQSFYVLLEADVGNGDEIVACREFGLTSSSTAIRYYNKYGC